MPQAPGQPPRRGRETLLLAEDDEHVRALMRIALSSNGYTLLEAVDGLEALELAGRHRDELDLVVSDVSMPGLGGPELVRALRADGIDVPALFVSGAAEEARRRLGLTEDEILAKPFGLAELAGRVRRALDGPPPGSNVR